VATHSVELAPGRVVKRFTSWDRGEHEREWLLLTALHRRAPGLGPRPLSADLTANPPSVTMSRVAGVPLGRALDEVQLDGLAVALARLWSLPVGILPPRRFLPDAVVETVRSDLGDQRWPDVVGRAVDVALNVHSGQLVGRRVVGHGDANLANYLWDGQRIRIIDFEDGGWSSLEYELASLIEHRSAANTCWDGFPERFGVDPERLRPARLSCAVTWLWLLLRRRPHSPAVLTQAVRVLALADQAR
jgi:hypothetical protein